MRPCDHRPCPNPSGEQCGYDLWICRWDQGPFGPRDCFALPNLVSYLHTKESLFMQWRFMIRKNGRERKIEFNGLPGKENELFILTLARSSQWDHRCNASSPATALLRDLVASGTSAWVRIVVLLWLSACAA